MKRTEDKIPEIVAAGTAVAPVEIPAEDATIVIVPVTFGLSAELLEGRTDVETRVEAAVDADRARDRQTATKAKDTTADKTRTTDMAAATINAIRTGTTDPDNIIVLR